MTRHMPSIEERYKNVIEDKKEKVKALRNKHEYKRDGKNKL